MRVERKRVVHPEGGKMLTKQSLAGATDINALLDRWMKHGEAVVHLNRTKGAYGDFSSGVDYQSALDQITGAQREFAALPADVRAHCNNDPADFLELIFDPNRREEVERLGLVDPPEGGEAAKVEPVEVSEVDELRAELEKVQAELKAKSSEE